MKLKFIIFSLVLILLSGCIGVEKNKITTGTVDSTGFVTVTNNVMKFSISDGNGGYLDEDIILTRNDSSAAIKRGTTIIYPTLGIEKAVPVYSVNTASLMAGKYIVSLKNPSVIFNDVQNGTVEFKKEIATNKSSQSEEVVKYKMDSSIKVSKKTGTVVSNNNDGITLTLKNIDIATDYKIEITTIENSNVIISKSTKDGDSELVKNISNKTLAANILLTELPVSAKYSLSIYKETNTSSNIIKKVNFTYDNNKKVTWETTNNDNQGNNGTRASLDVTINEDNSNDNIIKKVEIKFSENANEDKLLKQLFDLTVQSENYSVTAETTKDETGSVYLNISVNQTEEIADKEVAISLGLEPKSSALQEVSSESAKSSICRSSIVFTITGTQGSYSSSLSENSYTIGTNDIATSDENLIFAKRILIKTQKQAKNIIIASNNSTAKVFVIKDNTILKTISGSTLVDTASENTITYKDSFPVIATIVMGTYAQGDTETVNLALTTDSDGSTYEARFNVYDLIKSTTFTPTYGTPIKEQIFDFEVVAKEDGGFPFYKVKAKPRNVKNIDKKVFLMAEVKTTLGSEYHILKAFDTLNLKDSNISENIYKDSDSFYLQKTPKLKSETIRRLFLISPKTNIGATEYQSTVYDISQPIYNVVDIDNLTNISPINNDFVKRYGDGSKVTENLKNGIAFSDLDKDNMKHLNAKVFLTGLTSNVLYRINSNMEANPVSDVNINLTIKPNDVNLAPVETYFALSNTEYLKNSSTFGTYLSLENLLKNKSYIEMNSLSKGLTIKGYINETVSGDVINNSDFSKTNYVYSMNKENKMYYKTTEMVDLSKYTEVKVSKPAYIMKKNENIQPIATDLSFYLRMSMTERYSLVGNEYKEIDDSSFPVDNEFVFEAPATSGYHAYEQHFTSTTSSMLQTTKNMYITREEVASTNGTMGQNWEQKKVMEPRTIPGTKPNSLSEWSKIWGNKSVANKCTTVISTGVSASLGYLISGAIADFVSSFTATYQEKIIGKEVSEVEKTANGEFTTIGGKKYQISKKDKNGDFVPNNGLNSLPSQYRAEYGKVSLLTKTNIKDPQWTDKTKPYFQIAGAIAGGVAGFLLTPNVWDQDYDITKDEDIKVWYDDPAVWVEAINGDNGSSPYYIDLSGFNSTPEQKKNLRELTREERNKLLTALKNPNEINYANIWENYFVVPDDGKKYTISEIIPPPKVVAVGKIRIRALYQISNVDETKLYFKGYENTAELINVKADEKGNELPEIKTTNTKYSSVKKGSDTDILKPGIYKFRLKIQKIGTSGIIEGLTKTGRTVGWMVYAPFNAQVIKATNENSVLGGYNIKFSQRRVLPSNMIAEDIDGSLDKYLPTTGE